MITKYKSIIIGKLGDDATKNPKAPTHALKASVKDSKDKPVTVGKFWTKEGQFGKFLSGVMSDLYQGGEKIFEGYCIVNEQELDKLIEKLQMQANSPLGKDYPVSDPNVDSEIKPGDIDF